MQKMKMTMKILEYLKEYNKTDYKAVSRHIRTLAREENNDLNNLKARQRKKLIDNIDLMINEIILDLVSKNIITPVVNFEDFGKTVIIVTGPDRLEEMIMES